MPALLDQLGGTHAEGAETPDSPAPIGPRGPKKQDSNSASVAELAQSVGVRGHKGDWAGAGPRVLGWGRADSVEV